MGFVLMAGAAAMIVAAKSFGYEVMSVQTDSMSPAIQTKDAVIVYTNDTDIRTGDIVMYASPANAKVMVTHRVLDVNLQTHTFTARGDNLPVADERVPLAALQGAISYHVPFAGYVLDSFRHPVGLVAAVYLPAVGIILAEMRLLTYHFRGYQPTYYRLHGYAK